MANIKASAQASEEILLTTVIDEVLKLIIPSLQYLNTTLLWDDSANDGNKDGNILKLVEALFEITALFIEVILDHPPKWMISLISDGDPKLNPICLLMAMPSSMLNTLLELTKAEGKDRKAAA
jgi:hypothetical protein